MPIDVVKIRDFLAHTQAVYTLCKLSEEVFYSGGADAIVLEWSKTSGQFIPVLKTSSAVYAMSHIQSKLFVGCSKGQLYVIGVEQLCIQLMPAPIFDVVEFGQSIWVLQGNGFCSLLNADFTLLKHIQVSNKPLRKAVVFNDTICIVGSDGNMHLYNVDGKYLDTQKIDQDSIFALAIKPNPNQWYLAGKSGKLFSKDERLAISSLQAHSGTIHDMAFNADATLLATVSMDKSIRLWSTKDLELIKVVNYDKQNAHRNSVNKILWFGKNEFISCSDDHSIQWFKLLES